MGGWIDGWGGWKEVKAGLRIAYSNQKLYIKWSRLAKRYEVACRNFQVWILDNFHAGYRQICIRILNKSGFGTPTVQQLCWSK